MSNDVRIEPATVRDVPLILRLIKALAEYERLAHEVVATETSLRESFFGPQPAAQAVIACRSIGARPIDEWTVYRLTGDALTRLAER